ncbi:MAG TPA: hypothetical protein VLB87_08380 [Pyrinomonadaceae bacterium]|nr:hypothetical protein [Pyrinomonadaceae bacterium]
MSQIGLLNEKPLHAALKQWYARAGDRFEVPVDGFVIDIVRDDLLIEIQTRNFAAINAKLRQLTRSYEVRLVYPVVLEKWIVRLGTNGGKAVRRKSPKRGRLEDLFWELVSIPQLLMNPNFSLEVLLIREEEVRRFDRKARKWRRKGWVTDARRLVEVVDRRVFGHSADWLTFVPDGLHSFTTKDLATLANTRRDLAQKMAYCLREARMIELIGRQGRANLYRVPNKHPHKKTKQTPAENSATTGPSLSVPGVVTDIQPPAI